MPVERDQDAGFVLIAVVLASFVVFLLVTMLAGRAIAELDQSSDQRRDDMLIANAEAIIDRYASKLTINPQYYFQRVDEAERPRTCTAVGHIHWGLEVAPGDDWIDGCSDWEYLTEPTDDDWFIHPLIGSNDAVETLIEVSPPDEEGAVEIIVVGRVPGRVMYRAISASIQATSLSEFVRVTEFDLSYGSGAVLSG